MEPLLAAHHGRLVQVVGDGVLVEFGSVVDAVLCAVELQEAIAAHQAAVDADRRFQLRIGVNLGDVVADGDFILGDGVNVAARLEQLCEPGGVLVSETVREHVGNKLAVVFEYIGPLALKNIARPVGAHRIQQGAAPNPRPAPVPPAPPQTKPSVAVLPFVNLTGDADQDYFCEGIAEDLITELSKISGLFVAARQSTFAADQGMRDAAEVCSRLRVGFALEGSVRRAGDRVRISARLVHGASGGQVWAERYDRTIGDIFAVQDDITRSIVTALEVKLLLAEKEAMARPPTANIEAYKLYLHGLQQLRQHVRPAYELARRMFARAVELDPDFARALAGIGRVRLQPLPALRLGRGFRRHPRQHRPRPRAGADPGRCPCDARVRAAGHRSSRGGRGLVPARRSPSIPAIPAPTTSMPGPACSWAAARRRPSSCAGPPTSPPAMSATSTRWRPCCAPSATRPRRSRPRATPWRGASAASPTSPPRPWRPSPVPVPWPPSASGSAPSNGPSAPWGSVPTII